ncbi:MAG: amidohydrolase family protein [Candidatus Anammoximicrobium sp.]|nr:amidohydrolase family protein [Candidatus Anammoximicrobium sp.]
MSCSRRQFVQQAAGGLLTGGVLARAGLATTDEPTTAFPIVDTHQHLWDLEVVRPPWLKGSELLNRRFAMPEYREATRGLNVVKAVYMEVAVDPRDHVTEAEHVIGLCRSKQHPTVAAVIGGRPASDEFGDYLARFKGNPYVKGVRQVLHGATPAGHCVSDEYVRGIRLLGDAGLSFDLCLRAADLKDGAKLTELCPDTRFIVDHCGNADPKAFAARPDGGKPSHDPAAWKRDMDALAKRDNVICKISGIVASAPKDWTAADLAPIVNHCLDAFGPDRVVFGGDWPVCLKGATYRQWVLALREIVASRPAAEQRKLWHDNAVRFYGLEA